MLGQVSFLTMEPLKNHWTLAIRPWVALFEKLSSVPSDKNG